MADPSPCSDTGDDTGVGPGRESTTGTPRWVKVFGIIAIVLVLLIGGLMVFGGGSHGPGRHTPSGDAGGQTPPSSGTEDRTSGGDLGGHAPPEGGH